MLHLKTCPDDLYDAIPLFVQRIENLLLTDYLFTMNYRLPDCCLAWRGGRGGEGEIEIDPITK